MKAVLLKSFGDADQLYLDDAPMPQVTSNQVLIKVAAAALNRADILQRKGQYPPPAGASSILGLEVSGEVVETGSAAGKWRGTKVMSLLSGGGYAEYVAVDQGLLMQLPKSISLTSGAGIMEAYLTAYQSLHWLAKINQGDRLLIHAAASGVGTAAIQLAKVMDAEIWVTASQQKHALCLELGAHHCIDYRSEEFADRIRAEASEGIDVIMDFIGAPYLANNLVCLGVDGRMVIQGAMGGTKVDHFDLGPILKKRLSVLGSTLRSRSLEYRRALVADFNKTCAGKFETGSLKPVIDSIFDWQDVVNAHKHMEANRNQGKIILQVS